ncbi:MAG: helix-turn-helix domain-containing protein [Synergistaceae bacterium]|nr:helix-turn-helix domain-containing protein [Synergistaceae bacterium]
MDRECTSPEQIGKQLKQRRIDVGITLEKIFEDTKINVKYLKAIENGRFDLLPSGFYRKIFIHEYCDAIGADDLRTDCEQFLLGAGNISDAISDETSGKNRDKNFIQDTQYTKENNRPFIVVSGIAVVLAALLVFGFRETLSGAKTDAIDQLHGGTARVLEQKKKGDAELQRKAEEKARKQAEERAKAEETAFMEELEAEALGTVENSDHPKADYGAVPQLPAKNELIVKAAEGKIKIKVSQGENVIYDGEITEGKNMKFKIEGAVPVRVRYENPNRTEVYFGEAAFKPLHPSREGRSRYYWSDGAVTFTKQKTAKQ